MALNSVLMTPKLCLGLQFHLPTGHCLYDISYILQDQYVIAKLHKKARWLVFSSHKVIYAQCSKYGKYKRKNTTAKNIDVTPLNESSK